MSNSSLQIIDLAQVNLILRFIHFLSILCFILVELFGLDLSLNYILHFLLSFSQFSFNFALVIFENLNLLKRCLQIVLKLLIFFFEGFKLYGDLINFFLRHILRRLKLKHMSFLSSQSLSSRILLF